MMVCNQLIPFELITQQKLFKYILNIRGQCRKNKGGGGRGKGKAVISMSSPEVLYFSMPDYTSQAAQNSSFYVNQFDSILPP